MLLESSAVADERAQKRIDLAALTPRDWRRLITDLASARLVCFPTDTVYGVGGLLRPATGEAIQAAKGREMGKPLQVIFPSLELLLATVELSAVLTNVVRRLLPGPVTLLVPYPATFDYPPPGSVAHERHGLRRRTETYQAATLGVRVPRWPERARVLGALTLPLLASSANRSGAPEARSLVEVDHTVRAACDLLLDGGEVDGRPSTVIDFSSYEEDGKWRVVRPGALGEVAIREMLRRKRKDLPDL